MRRICIVVLVLHLLLSCASEVAWVPYYHDCGGFKSYGERVKWYKLLKKHGLLSGVNLIEYDSDKREWFFIREKDGRRIRFCRENYVQILNKGEGR